MKGSLTALSDFIAHRHSSHTVFLTLMLTCQFVDRVCLCSVCPAQVNRSTPACVPILSR